jgi:hypothetical protein
MKALDDLGAAVSVGFPDELYERQRRDGTPALVPSSTEPRGLALRSLAVTKVSEGLWGLLKRSTDVYVLSVSFDLSGAEPVVLPPKAVSGDLVYRVQKGEVLRFTLGDGMPIFPARPLTGGLVTYIQVCEADQGVRHIGEVMAEVHADLSGDGSLAGKLQKLIANPGATMVDEILGAAVAAIQPIATILKRNGDDSVGAFSGIYAARGPWADKLTATQNGTTITLAELR